MNDRNEEGLKAVVLAKDDQVYMEFCTIGFLPQAMVSGFKARYENKTCRVIEMYGESESKHKRRMDHRSYGACAFEFVADIVSLE